MNVRGFLIAALAASSMLACASGGAQAQGDWQFLGQREVTDRADHDQITVTRAEGDFESVRLEVRRAPVDFHRVVVHYANGTSQEVDLRSTIPAGGQSRAIDLSGDERFIRSVEFWYDAHTARGRRAIVRLYGQQ